MDSPIRRPEEILASRSLKQVLEAKPKALWTIGPRDNVLAALQLMSDKNIGFLVVLDGDALLGVVSERDCARRVMLAGRPPQTTSVADIMVRDVVTATPEHTYADCLKLMDSRSIRHLPVVERGRVVAVVSIRDLLSEAVKHHARIIAELERERLTIFTSMA